jgi:glutaredoxin
MSHRLLLYSRKDCCLCDEMKAIIGAVGENIPLEFEEIDVDSSPALQELYGEEVPLLFIDGRKAFRYRVTAQELRRRLKKQ